MGYLEAWRASLKDRMTEAEKWQSVADSKLLEADQNGVPAKFTYRAPFGSLGIDYISVVKLPRGRTVIYFDEFDQTLSPYHSYEFHYAVVLRGSMDPLELFLPKDGKEYTRGGPVSSFRLHDFKNSKLFSNGHWGGTKRLNAIK